MMIVAGRVVDIINMINLTDMRKINVIKGVAMVKRSAAVTAENLSTELKKTKMTLRNCGKQLED